jgi:hypothetical protein
MVELSLGGLLEVGIEEDFQVERSVVDRVTFAITPPTPFGGACPGRLVIGILLKCISIPSPLELGDKTLDRGFIGGLPLLPEAREQVLVVACTRRQQLHSGLSRVW